MARIQNDVSSIEKLVISKKLQMCLPFNPAIPLLAIFSEDKLQEIKNRCEQQKGIQAPEMISSPKV